VDLQVDTDILQKKLVATSKSRWCHSTEDTLGIVNPLWVFIVVSVFWWHHL
jgi:hypothetical protein